jgi:glucose/arabinose dehydrogenase
MKKFLPVLILVLLGFGLWAGLFYWQNLRGAGPAFQGPDEDIAALLPSSQVMTSGTQTIFTQETTQQAVPQNTTEMPLKLPEGFGISIYAKNLVNPRVMVKDPKGVIIVSTPSQGKVVALPDADADGTADRNITVAENLDRPHGLAFRCPDPGALENCELYIAETGNVSRYTYDPVTFKATLSKKIADLPPGGRHFSRTIMFLDDEPNRLLVSVGSSCNVCDEEDERRAKIMVVDVETGEMKPYATGLRNAVFMTHDPSFAKVYATEMGRDLIGDDIPPDEINLIEEGKNYGWPICYGQNVHDTDFDHNTYIRNPCMEPFETPAAVDLQAHSAPLGLAFFPETWPQTYKGNLLVAYHGSWNRTVPTGYKIIMLKAHPDPENQKLTFDQPEDFITGWIKGGAALGRPVDILIEPTRNIYVSDDKAGVIYLLRYFGQ